MLYAILHVPLVVLQSTAVPAVWVSADHLCILWCKQLVLSLARALFDTVDLRTKQIADDPVTRHRAFSYHLLHVSYVTCHGIFV